MFFIEIIFQVFEKYTGLKTQILVLLWDVKGLCGKTVWSSV